MMNDVKFNNYKIALVEVEAVLNCLEHDDYCKIPKEIIDVITKNKDECYIFEYDENLDFKYWSLMPETKALLYNLLKKYLATNEQKKYFVEKEKFEIWQLEKEKSEKYNQDDIFKNKKTKKNKEKSIESKGNISLIEYKETYFTRLKKFILKLLHISRD